MMKATDVKFVIFSFGMGAAIASSFISIYILAISFIGGKSMVHEGNPILAIAEIILLTFAIGTCITATEIYQRYQKMNASKNKSQH